MPELIRVGDITTEHDILVGLAKCSAYPQSEARTRSTDTLLDHWNALQSQVESTK